MEGNKTVCGDAIVGDNRFEVIEKAKKALIKSTNIESSPDEMKVLDTILFRCWQMGWLDRYNTPIEVMPTKPKNMAHNRIQEEIYFLDDDDIDFF